MTHHSSDLTPTSAALLPACPPGPAVRAMSTAVLSHRAGLAGKCSDTGDDRAFPEPPRGGWTPSREAEYARRLCDGCTVKGECLELALRYENRPGRYRSFGVWGGTTPRERQAMIRSRRAAGAVAS